MLEEVDLWEMDIELRQAPKVVRMEFDKNDAIGCENAVIV